MRTKICQLLLLGLLFWNCNSQNADKIQTLSPAEYAEKLKTTPNAQLIDVRTPQEFSGEHLEAARNINWNGPDFEKQVGQYDKSKPVFVYCKVGGRSAQAAEKLAGMGFKHVYNLQGGIMKWNAAGMGAPSDSGKIIGMCSQEYAELIKSGPKVLVNFYADWCAPCKKMAPYMTQLGTQYQGKITVARLNADENKTLVKEMQLDTLPVLLLYQDGKVVWSHEGYIAEDELKSHLQ